MVIAFEDLELPDAHARLFPTAFDSPESDRLFEDLQEGTGWRQQSIRMFGRPVNQPRLIAFHGDPGCAYTYSGLTLDPEPWTEPMLQIRECVEMLVGAEYNCVLLNLYRDGSDSMGWHSDDERELGEDPVIASVSLGAVRTFQMKHRTRSDLSCVNLDLPHGSLLVMAGPMQAYWKHRLPKTSAVCAPRINLTFRQVLVER